MSRFHSRGVLWRPMVLLAWTASLLPTIALVVLLHDRHVMAVDLACAHPAVATVSLQRGDPQGLLTEAAARCHVEYAWQPSSPWLPMVVSTRTWVFPSHPAPDGHLGSVLPLLATALPGLALLLGLAGMRSMRRRVARSRAAWLTHVAVWALLCLGTAAAAGLVVVQHDVSVTREDFQCGFILGPEPARIGESYAEARAASIAKARTKCNLEYHLEVHDSSESIGSYSVRTWLAPRSGQALQELDATRVPLGIVLGLSLLGLVSLGAMSRLAAR